MKLNKREKIILAITGLMIYFIIFIPIINKVQSIRHSKSIKFKDSNQIQKIEPQLILLNWNWKKKHGFAIAEGQVKNVSSRPLHNIEVIVTFFTSNGELITFTSALLEYNPIMPTQISPFKVIATYNPLMTKAGIDFKFLMGASIQWTNQQEKGPRMP